MNAGQIIGSIAGLLISGTVCGFICRKIRESKGMEGGFGWGFWLGVIGIIVVATQQPPQVYDLASAVAASPYSAPTGPAPGDWRCFKCRKMNSARSTVCSCGMTKAQSELLEKKAENERQKAASIRREEEDREKAIAGEADKKRTEEENTIGLLKKYKDLLDSGVITQEEFEQKKKELMK